MPETPKGLNFLGHTISIQNTEESLYENIFDTIDEQLLEARSKRDKYTIVMPMFQLASNIPAEKYLRQVKTLTMLEIPSNVPRLQ